MTHRETGRQTAVVVALLAALPLVLALGCSARKTTVLDLDIPERKTTVEGAAPSQILTAAMNDEEPGHRARALQILIGRAPSSELPALATRALWDPEPWVQRVSVQALILRLPDPQVRESLLGFVLRTDELADPHARATAAVALNPAADPTIARAIHDGWRAERAPWRQAPLQLVAAQLGDADALTALAETLAEGEIGLEPDFLLAIGRSGLPALIEPLTQATPWVEPDIRLSVLTARLLLGDPQAERELRTTLTGGEEIAVLEALDFLTRIDHPAAHELIGKVKASTPLAQSYAAMALRARGDGPDRRFDEAMDRGDAETRELAVRFAGEALDRQDLARKAQKVALRVIDQGLTDPTHAVRLAALRSATADRFADTLDKIRPLLTDELTDVRIEAARVLIAAE